MQSVDLDDIARRPQRYWDVDGLPELVMGLVWIVWGGAWLFGQTLSRGWTATAYWLAVPALLATSGWVAIWAVRSLKARLTFPRTGYVDWKAPSRGARFGYAAMAAVVAALLVVGLMLIGDRGERAATPILTVILSLGFVVASLRQRAPHFLGLSAVALALGLALSARAGGWTSVNWLLVALGAASAVVGGVRLALFMRHHPRPLTEPA